MPIRILLVEDNLTEARFLRSYLDRSELEFEIHHAQTLEEGIEMGTQTAPDIIVLDLFLPDSTGESTFERMKNALPESPIVILSSHADEETARRAVGQGAQDYLVKGTFSAQAVSRALMYAAERHRFTRDRRALESQLTQRRQLETIGQLAAGIAHEINTPTQYVGDNVRFSKDALVEIGALFDQLRELSKRDTVAGSELLALLDGSDAKYLMEELPNALEQSLEGLGSIARIVRAMKEFSHPATDEKVPTNLNRTIEAAVVVASNEWKYVAETELDLDPSLPAVTCLPGEMSQVFLNLIVNAAHAIGALPGASDGTKGRIVLTSRHEEGLVTISVADTGCGIPPDLRSRVFEPFFTTKEIGKGTGQGLAITYDVVVKKHGGKIEVDSEEGKGTAFFIHLPLSPDSEAGIANRRMIET